MERQESFCKLCFENGTAKITEKGTKPVLLFSAPLKIFLEITNHCNLNCSFCANKSGSGRYYHLSLEQINRIMQEAHKMKVFEMALTGGEPLLHPDFPRILETIGEYGFPISINTNACVDESVWKTLIETKAPIKFVTVSIDGLKKMHDTIRGDNAFNKTEGNINTLIKAVNEKKIKTTLKILFTAYPYNECSIEETIAWAYDLGCDIKIAPMIPFDKRERGIKEKDIRLSFSEINKRVKNSEIIKKIEEDKKIHVSWATQFHIDSTFKDNCKFLLEQKRFFFTPCGIRSINLGINCKGEAFASGRQTDFYPEYKVGDINKDSLQEIWLNSILGYAKLYTVCDNKGDECKKLTEKYTWDDFEKAWESLYV